MCKKKAVFISCLLQGMDNAIERIGIPIWAVLPEAQEQCASFMHCICICDVTKSSHFRLATITIFTAVLEEQFT